MSINTNRVAITTVKGSFNTTCFVCCSTEIPTWKKVSYVYLALLFFVASAAALSAGLQEIPFVSLYPAVAVVGLTLVAALALRCLKCQRSPKAQTGFQPRLMPIFSSTSLDQLVEDGDFDGLVKFLKSFKKDEKLIKAAFNRAFKLNHLKIANLLLRYQFSNSLSHFPDAETQLHPRLLACVGKGFDLPPLHFAAAYGYAEGVKWVLTEGGLPYELWGIGKDKYFYVQLAIYGGHASIVALATERHQLKLMGGDQLLYEAVSFAPNAETIKPIITYLYGDLSSLDYGQHEPLLFRAIKSNNYIGVRTLLECGADPYISSCNTQAYELALGNANMEACLLRNHFFTYKEKKINLLTWQDELLKGRPEFVERFVTLAPLCPYLGMRIYFLALLVDDPEIKNECVKLGMLLSETAIASTEGLIDGVLEQKSYALLAVCLKGGFYCPQACKGEKLLTCIQAACLLDNIPLEDVPKIMDEGLAYAIEQDLTISERLIIFGMDVNQLSRNKEGVKWTPLHAAVAKGNIKLVNALLQHEADIYAKDEKGIGPLGYTIDKKLIFLFLKKWSKEAHALANVKSKDLADFETGSLGYYLLLAIQKNHFELFEALQKMGAFSKEFYSSVPFLVHAARLSTPAFFQLLLKAFEEAKAFSPKQTDIYPFLENQPEKAIPFFEAFFRAHGYPIDRSLIDKFLKTPFCFLVENNFQNLILPLRKLGVRLSDEWDLLFAKAYLEPEKYNPFLRRCINLYFLTIENAYRKLVLEYKGNEEKYYQRAIPFFQIFFPDYYELEKDELQKFVKNGLDFIIEEGHHLLLGPLVRKLGFEVKDSHFILACKKALENPQQSLRMLVEVIECTHSLSFKHFHEAVAYSTYTISHTLSIFSQLPESLRIKLCRNTLVETTNGQCTLEHYIKNNSKITLPYPCPYHLALAVYVPELNRYLEKISSRLLKPKWRERYLSIMVIAWENLYSREELYAKFSSFPNGFVLFSFQYLSLESRLFFLNQKIEEIGKMENKMKRYTEASKWKGLCDWLIDVYKKEELPVPEELEACQSELKAFI
jgi:hypothetical protein